MSALVLHHLHAGGSVVLCPMCGRYEPTRTGAGGETVVAHYPADPRIPCRGSGRSAGEMMSEAARCAW